MVDVTALYLPREDDFDSPPSVVALLDYLEELQDKCPHISLDWSIHEIQEHSLNFVRVGLVAFFVKRYKLWKPRYKDFKDFCISGLGRGLWSIKKMIDAAMVVVELAKAGFDQLPHNESQCRPLTKFRGEDLIEKWREVTSFMPSDRQTSNAIAAIVDETPVEKRKATVKVSARVATEIRERAAEAGMSVNDFLESMLEMEPDSPDEPDETGEPEKLTTEEEEGEEEEEEKAILAHHRWLEDLDELLLNPDEDFFSGEWGQSLEPE